ncbi:hypothetical protein NFJ02_14g17530 [Pycnococcus provasolii]
MSAGITRLIVGVGGHRGGEREVASRAQNAVVRHAGIHPQNRMSKYLAFGRCDVNGGVGADKVVLNVCDLQPENQDRTESLSSAFLRRLTICGMSGNM